jgi:phospholipid N-methyltransferase
VSLGSLQQYYATEFRSFLRCWIDDPRAVGAVAPSGRALARLMTAQLRPGARVLELGPGTGTVTRAILDRGVLPRDLYLLERSPRFAAMLGESFPDATVVLGDATHEHAMLAPLSGTFDFVVSGLPLVLFSATQKRTLLGRAFELLSEAGSLYQFTYGLRCPIRRNLLADSGLAASRIGTVALNVPPAFVYRITRRHV